jgi:3-oxoacyl-[acyl-carrier-protein] synthase-3
MGLQETSIPAFDINATCLSFLAALDNAACLISAGRYRRILIVSSEVASQALDWEHKESCILFGDGAAAVIVGVSERTGSIIAAKFETYARGAHLAEVKGGGTAVHPRQYSEATKTDFLFRMDGEKLFRMSLEYVPAFMHSLMQEAGTCLDKIDLIIPHQASLNGLQLLQRRLGIPDHKFLIRIQEYGNTIAASIPMVLNDAIKNQRIGRGGRVMLIGTAAGFSIGGVIFDY